VDLNSDGEDSFNDVVQFIKDELSTAAKKDWGKMSTAERQFAERAVDGFATEAPSVADIIGKLPPADRDRALGAVARLLESTMHMTGIASRSGVSELVHRSAAQSSAGKAPRRKTPMQQRMDELSEKYLRLKPNATPHATAKFMMENWGDETTTPDLSTMQRHVKRKNRKA
jgi:hypothetical protein